MTIIQSFRTVTFKLSAFLLQEFAWSPSWNFSWWKIKNYECGIALKHDFHKFITNYSLGSKSVSVGHTHSRVVG
jgi:hypothetical protein